MGLPIVTLFKLDGTEEKTFYLGESYIPFFWDYFPDCLRESISELEDNMFVLGAGYWRINPPDKSRLARLQIGNTGTRKARDDSECTTFTREIVEETGFFIPPEVQRQSQFKFYEYARMNGFRQKWYSVKIHINRVEVPSDPQIANDDDVNEDKDIRRFKIAATIYGKYDEVVKKVKQTIDAGYVKSTASKDNIGWIAVLNVGYVKSQKPYMK